MKIKIYENIIDMTGYGEEWLVIGDNVLAIFINGQLKTYNEIKTKSVEEDTLVL